MNPRVWWLLATLAACDRPVTPGAASSTSPAPTPPAPTAPAASSSAAPRAEPSAPAAASVAPAAPAGAPRKQAFPFDADALAGPPAGFEAVIGDWSVAERQGAKGLLVDGSRWRSGTASISLVDQAKRLYGDRYAEFLDGVKAFAFFPLIVAQKEPPAGDLRMSVRFYPFAGSVDQAAGIAFGIQPDGSYACIRANALEDNILWAKVVRGKRTILDTIRNVPTPTKTWHTLVVELKGTALHVELDGKGVFDKKLDAAPRGRVGLWSKADSQVLFDDFEVTALGG